MSNLITNSERLILINQYKILANIEKQNSDYYNDLIFYLTNGDINGYNNCIELSSPICQETYKEVHNILNMFELLGDSHNKLTVEDKKDIDSDSIRFQGFDNNHDDKHNQVKRVLQYKQKNGNLDMYRNIDFNLNDVRPLDRYRRPIVK